MRSDAVMTTAWETGGWYHLNGRGPLPPNIQHRLAADEDLASLDLRS
jgi:hypothetical protein